MTESIEDTDLEQDEPAEAPAEEPAEPAAELDTSGELAGKTVSLQDGQTGKVVEENASMVLLEGSGWQHRGNITSVAD